MRERKDPDDLMRWGSVNLPAWMWGALKREALKEEPPSVSAVIRRLLVDSGLRKPGAPLSVDALCDMCYRAPAVEYNRGKHYCAECFDLCDICDRPFAYRDWRRFNGPLCFNCRRPDRWERMGRTPPKPTRGLGKPAQDQTASSG